MSLTQQILELTFGRDNIRKWADINNDDDEALILNRITRAITLAPAHLDSLVKGYKDLPDNDVVDDVLARVAGIWLYDTRGLADEDKDKSPVAHHRKYVNDWVRSYRDNSVNFELPTGPCVVNEDDDS